MTIPFFDLKEQYSQLRDDIARRLDDVFASQRFIMGPAVAELEQAVAELVGVPHAVSCASGTDALLLPLKALQLEPGDEVITTPYTFFATAGAIVNAGGKPVFVDVLPDTLNIDPDAVAAAVGERTRAIIPVHLFGQMARMEPVMALAERHGLTVIEDAAQAIGAAQLFGNTRRQAGSIGTAGTFSFFPTKNLGGWGDGGMITTSDQLLADRLRLLRVHGGAKQYHHDEVGTNSRLDTVQAAVLLAKLPHLGRWNQRRVENALAYTKAFASIEGITPLSIEPGNEPVYHQYTVRAERRDELLSYLKERDIGAAVYYPCALHLQPCFAPLGYGNGSLPVAEAAMRDAISFPVFPELTDAQRTRVIEMVSEFYS